MQRNYVTDPTSQKKFWNKKNVNVNEKMRLPRKRKSREGGFVGNAMNGSPKFGVC